MPAPRSTARFSPSLPFILLLILIGMTWLAGGASRADVLGQVLVRTTAWLLLVVTILFGRRPEFARARPIWWFLLAATALVLIQLIPLPPGLWSLLPGRAPLLEAGAIAGQGQPWRPWSIVPGATLNAAFSLVVPLATLVLMTGIRDDERTALPVALLIAVGAAALLGLMQFSGSAFNNPFLNETPGQVSGNFANRNHFALFMALGCPLVAAWMFRDGRRPGWRGAFGPGLIVLFLLTILATGSRAGIGLGMAALVLGLMVARQPIRRALARYPRWVFPALVAGLVAVVALFVALSFVSSRAVSIDRLFALDQVEDMRSRGIPVVLAMIADYFPSGAGVGSFDPIFRMHEPFALLKPTYFNHAHNDFLEVALDAGLPGIVLLAAAVGWWGRASITAWRPAVDRQDMLPRLGSVLLLLILIASAFDYPVRTPMMMMVTIMAAVWLNGARGGGGAARAPDVDA